jgi:hypothetical protein
MGALAAQEAADWTKAGAPTCASVFGART